VAGHRVDAEANRKERAVLIKHLSNVALLGSGWVLYLLLGLSVVSLGIMFERWTFFRKHRGDVRRLGNQLLERLRKGDRRGAEELLRRSPTLEAATLLPVLDWLDGGPDAVSEALEAEIGRQRHELERGLTFLGTLGNNAPFVGLLGTVIGVIDAFHQLGAGQTKAQMGNVMIGISEALVATGVGLLVALPAVVAFNVAQKKIAEIESNVEVIGKQVLALLESEAKLVHEFRLIEEMPPDGSSQTDSLPPQDAPEPSLDALASHALEETNGRARQFS
jgi:biopolymer transport protein TolQ